MKAFGRSKATDNAYDNKGRSVSNPDINLKRFESPFELQAYLKKNPSKTFATIDQEFYVGQGHRYQAGDYLFGADRETLFKHLFDWDRNAKFFADYDMFDDAIYYPSLWIDHEDFHAYTLVSLEPVKSNSITESDMAKLTEMLMDTEWQEFYFWPANDCDLLLDELFAISAENDFPIGQNDEKEIEAYIQKHLKVYDLDHLTEMAVCKGHTRMLDILESQFAVNLMCPSIMRFAGWHGKLSVCQHLESKGLSSEVLRMPIDGLFEGTLLHDLGAEFHDNLSDDIRIIEVAVHYNLDINAVDIHGETPLHLCAKHNNHSLYKILVEHGADESIPNRHGMNAKQIIDMHASYVEYSV